MSKPLVAHYFRVSRKVDMEISKLTWSDYINCPNIEELVKLSIINRENLNKDLCKDPFKWQGNKEESFKKNEKDILFKKFSERKRRIN